MHRLPLQETIDCKTHTHAHTHISCTIPNILILVTGLPVKPIISSTMLIFTAFLPQLKEERSVPIGTDEVSANVTRMVEAGTLIQLSEDDVRMENT